MQRWFDHGAMNKACGVFAANQFVGALEKLAGATPEPDLQLVARTFRNLQQARHKADYDLTTYWTRVIAEQNILSVRRATEAWHRTKKNPQATVFAHALLDLKRVETERQ